MCLISSAAARVLPKLALPVPMKPKLRQVAADFGWRFGFELNPDPRPHNGSHFPLQWHPSLQNLQDSILRKFPIRFAFGVVHVMLGDFLCCPLLLILTRARLFGTALEL